jgi:hypothetical protein
VPVKTGKAPLLVRGVTVIDWIEWTGHLPHFTLKSASRGADNLLDDPGREMPL